MSLPRFAIPSLAKQARQTPMRSRNKGADGTMRFETGYESQDHSVDCTGSECAADAIEEGR